MTDAAGNFRSKYAGKPGSLMAIRVDYPLRTPAFDSFPRDSEKVIRRESIQTFARGQRIGDKPLWNASCVDEKAIFPDRAIARSISEFQAVKIEYNYRAAVIPSVNHNSVYVPKPNKMQMDRSLFLSKDQKERLVQHCPGTSAALSRREMGNEGVPNAEREGAWNVSHQPDDIRTNLFRSRPEVDYREKNKMTHPVNDATYVNPQDRHTMQASGIRDKKLSLRHLDTVQPASSVAEGAPVVFKISNLNEWWDKVPPELRQAEPETSPIPSDD